MEVRLFSDIVMYPSEIIRITLLFNSTRPEHCAAECETSKRMLNIDR